MRRTLKYRAWGGLKSLEYGNGVTNSTSYNNRLLPDEFLLEKSSAKIMEKEYEYNPDGTLKFLDDKLNNNFDRLNIYDHMGRVVQGKSGLEAHGTPVTVEDDQETGLPYRQSYSYNAFGNMTQRNNRHWGKESYGYQNFNLNYTYANNRITNVGWIHDEDGRVLTSSTPDEGGTSVYDARGMLSRMMTYLADSGRQYVSRYYDGDGREVKRTKINLADESYTMTTWPYGTWTDEGPKYYIRSSALGGAVISETNASGAKKSTNVMAAGAKIATQSEYTFNSNVHDSIAWEHYDPSGMSFRGTPKLGSELSGDGQFEGGPAEMDPKGGNVGLATPYFELISPPEPPSGDWGFIPMESDAPLMVNGQRVGCTVDGMSMGCGTALGMLGNSLDIDFANSDLSILRSMGISWRQTREIGVINAPTPPGGNPDTAYATTLYEYEYYGHERYAFSTTTWLVDTPQERAEKAIVRTLESARNFLKNNPDCAKFLDKIASNLRLSADEINRTEFGMGDDGRLTAQSIGVSGLLDLAAKAKVIRTDNSGTRVEGGMEYTNNLAARPGEIYVHESFMAGTKPPAQRYAVIHEAFHMLQGADDHEIYRAAQLADGTSPGKLDTKKNSGDASAEFNRIVQRRCDGLSTDTSTTIRPGG